MVSKGLVSNLFLQYLIGCERATIIVGGSADWAS